MKIRRLLLRDFGCLRGEYHFAADRVNLVLEPNERGKSTLAEAILAGLYGFPPGQRRSESRPFPDLELHRPWSGEEYLVEMDVEADGQVFTIRRDFARREERVYEWRSGKDITEEFAAARDQIDFAGRITGLDRDDFVRTALLRQSEMRDVGNATGLTAALQRIATSQQGDVAAAEAIETLNGAGRQFRGRKIRRGKIESEIAEIEEEIRSLSERLRGMEERRRQAEERILDLEKTSKEEGQVDTELQRLEHLVIASGRREDAARLEEEVHERADLEEREAEFQSLARYADFPTSVIPRLREIKGRLLALAEEEERVRQRARAEIDGPIHEIESRSRERAGIRVLAASELSRFSEAESDLAAAWKSRREGRRSLRALSKRHAEEGLDTDRLKALSKRFGGLVTEDRRFLLACGEQEMSARSAASEMERDVARADEALSAEEGRLQRSRGARVALAAAGALLAVAAVALFLSRQPRGWAYAAVAAAAAGAAAAFVILIRRALRPGAAAQAKLASLMAEKKGLASSMAAKQEEARSIRARLDSIASQLGFAAGDDLLAEFRESESRHAEVAEQASRERLLGEAEGALLAASSRIMEIIRAAGYRPRFGAATPRTARRFRTLAAAERESASRLADLRERRAAVARQLAGLESDRAALRREAASLVAAAGVPSTDDLDTAIARTEEALSKHERYGVLKREVIPALVRRSLSHQGEPLRRAVDVAEAVLRRRTQENPSLASLVPEKTHKEYVEERDRLRQASRSLAERRLQLSSELGEVLREYRKEYPDTQRWLREWKEHLDRTVAFKRAVEIASETLESLSREAYAEWADVLNERSSEAIRILCPGYDDIRFDESLSFTIRSMPEGSRRTRDDVDHRFSSGTRDQVYLAARLAMAGYLSSGKVRLPLVLDDPLAAFDDDRFSRAMEMLVDKVSRRHQVILLSCHEARHRTWQERNSERFADRVRVMTLQMPAV